jgi:hypothetical protein
LGADRGPARCRRHGPSTAARSGQTSGALGSIPIPAGADRHLRDRHGRLAHAHTTLQGQAFQSRTLNRQATELAYAQADLENQLDALAAPQELARRASALGMRPNPYPAFLVLPSGKVIGKPTSVQGHELPAFIVKTPAEIAAERAAKRARAEAEAAAKAAKREQRRASQTKASQTKANQTKANQTAGTTKKGTDRGGRP